MDTASIKQRYLALVGLAAGLLSVILTGFWLWPYNLLLGVGGIVSSVTAAKKHGSSTLTRAGLISSITGLALFAILLLIFLLIG